jgi:PAS domain S-box-containing protein
MRPLGALILAALGFALVHPGKDLRVAFAVGLAVAAIIALLVALIPFDVDLSAIDRWLAPGSVLPPGSFQVQGASAVSFVLAGGALALGRFERHRVAATILGGIVGTIAVFALLGYLAGIDTLYGAVSVNSPPLPVVIGLLCAAGGITLRIGRMPVLRTSRPLWHRLVFLGSAIVAPLLLFGAYAGFRLADAQFRNVREELAIAARTLSANVDREIIGEMERLQALAASPSLRHGDFAEFQRQAEASLAMRQSGNIVLIDRNMQQLVNTAVPFGTPLPKTAVPDPVERAIATGTPQITGLFVGRTTKRVLFGIVVPVEIEGERRYALFRSPDQRALGRLVAAHELPTSWHARAAVCDTAHRIIARSPQDDGFIGKELPPSQWHGAEPGGVFEFVDSEGRPSLEAYARSELTGWETVVWAPTAVLEAPVRAQWRILGMMALLALTLVVAFALWLGGIIARSVGHAADAAIALGRGRPLPPSGTPIDEINTLMAELRATADLVREREGQLRLVSDTAPVGIVHCDEELRYKFVNRNRLEHLKRRLGLTPEQVIGKRIPEVIGDSVFAIVEPYVYECLAGKSVEFEVEMPFEAAESRCLHCRFEPEWRDGKVVGLVSAETNITRLKRTEAALRESEAAFRAMFEVSSVSKAEIESGSGRFLRANAAMCTFVGYAEAELLALTIFDITHPDERERDRERLRRLVAGESTVFDEEQRFIRKDGNVIWGRMTVNVIRDGSGRALCNIAVILDITERKEREEKERLLMREISHRAKNMLSVVQSIAQQTATRKPEDFVESFSERIQALAASQDLLVRNEWNGVEIKDLTQAQLAHFADLIGHRIILRGPTLRFNAASAQAVGLALHELATNAAKYGALSTDTGHVDIAWRTDGRTFTMSWTERDGPPVSAPRRRGFGTTVMDAMVERSLDGKVDLDYPVTGVTWRLTCRSANALESGERSLSFEGREKSNWAQPSY